MLDDCLSRGEETLPLFLISKNESCWQNRTQSVYSKRGLAYGSLVILDDINTYLPKHQVLTCKYSIEKLNFKKKFMKKKKSEKKSHKKESNICSNTSFRSRALRVMSPARFRCAMLLDEVVSSYISAQYMVVVVTSWMSHSMLLLCVTYIHAIPY